MPLPSPVAPSVAPFDNNITDKIKTFLEPPATLKELRDAKTDRIERKRAKDPNEDPDETPARRAGDYILNPCNQTDYWTRSGPPDPPSSQDWTQDEQWHDLKVGRGNKRNNGDLEPFQRGIWHSSHKDPDHPAFLTEFGSSRLAGCPKLISDQLDYCHQLGDLGTTPLRIHPATTNPSPLLPNRDPVPIRPSALPIVRDTQPVSLIPWSLRLKQYAAARNQ